MPSLLLLEFRQLVFNCIHKLLIFAIVWMHIIQNCWIKLMTNCSSKSRQLIILILLCHPWTYNIIYDFHHVYHHSHGLSSTQTPISDFSPKLKYHVHRPTAIFRTCPTSLFQLSLLLLLLLFVGCNIECVVRSLSITFNSPPGRYVKLLNITTLVPKPPLLAQCYL